MDDRADFGVLLAVAQAVLMDRLIRHMRAASFDGFTTRYGAVLRLLADGPLSLRDLARNLGMTSPGALKLVTAMAQAGYVSRVAAEGDRRVRLVETSPRGRAALAEARRVHASLENELVRDLGVDVVEHVRLLLDHLARGDSDSVPAAVRRAALGL